jgi:hypothetical protein
MSVPVSIKRKIKTSSQYEIYTAVVLDIAAVNRTHALWVGPTLREERPTPSPESLPTKSLTTCEYSNW